MINKDTLQRFLFETLSLRGEMVHLNESYQAIIELHPYPTFIKKLLGEALVIVSLMYATIKFNGRLTLQFQSKEALKLLLVQCHQDFNIRGLAQYDTGITAETMQHSLEKGTLVIRIDPDLPGGKQYQGIVAWQGKTLAESIESYFQLSEQLPTHLWVAVNDTTAAGLLLQHVAGEKSETGKEGWEHILTLTHTLTPEELLTLDHQTLLRRLYHEEEVRVFSPQKVIFSCTCSRKRSENAILLLGREEAEDELINNQSIAVTCEFCNSEYIFDKGEVNVLFEENEKSSRLH